MGFVDSIHDPFRRQFHDPRPGAVLPRHYLHRHVAAGEDGSERRQDGAEHPAGCREVVVPNQQGRLVGECRSNDGFSFGFPVLFLRLHSIWAGSVKHEPPYDPYDPYALCNYARGGKNRG